jgi:hypothetical protein
MGKEMSLPSPRLARGGRRISIEFTIFPYHDRDGSVRGIGAILRDVTKRFEETKALRKEVVARQATPPNPSSGCRDFPR